MRLHFLLYMAFLLPFCTFAQLQESFDGSEITTNNPWQGDLDYFEINADKELQLNGTLKEGEAKLFLPTYYKGDNEWQFTVKSGSSGTTHNYCLVCLWSETNRTDKGLRIYVRVGYNSKNNIQLCTTEHPSDPIVEGRSVAKGAHEVDVKVVYTDGVFELFTRTKEEADYTKEGEASYSLPTTAGFFILATRFSSSYSQKKYFDNIYIKHYAAEDPNTSDPDEPDPVPEASTLIDLIEVNSKVLQVEFSQPLQLKTKPTFVLSEMGEPDNFYANKEKTILQLEWEKPRNKDQRYTLSYSNIKDVNGKSVSGNTSFSSEMGESGTPEDNPSTPSLQLGAIQINEVMADPNGLTALPETEYVELLNTTAEKISLNKCTFVYGTTQIELSNIELPAGGYAVLCRSGRDIEVGNGIAIRLDKFPAALANTGKELAFKDASGQVIDAIAYEKAKAAQSFERKDKGWQLCSAPNGGTPGMPNSDGIKEEPDEPKDPDTPEDPDVPDDPDEPEAQMVEPFDIVFNELLPRPFIGGSEYIELYNRSGKTLFTKGLCLSIRRSDGSLSSSYLLEDIQGGLADKAYLVLTKDKEGVSDFYSTIDIESIHEQKMPILNNEASTVVLYRKADNVVIDEIAYTKAWHEPSKKEQVGVSLERVSFEHPTQDKTNWTSASSTVGYGTPGCQNSQKEPITDITTIERPEYVDIEGFYRIVYRTADTGWHVRIRVFDLSGRVQAVVADDDLLGTEGCIEWDGTGLDGGCLSAGLYIFHASLFHLDGRTKEVKRAFVIH